MDHREFSIALAQQAITRALAIYVDGGGKNDVRQTRFGLSVLRHATEEQLTIAMPLVEVSQHMTRAGIRVLLARQ